MSEVRKSSERDSTAAPFERYSSSGNPAAVPAPDSTATSSPDFTSGGTAAGMTATRVSPGSVSLGMPILISVFFRVLLWRGLLLQPVADRLGDGGRNAFVRQRRVFGNVTGFRRRQQVVDSGQVDDLNRRRFLTRARKRGELIAVMWKYLLIEIALDDEERLLDLLHHLGRVELQQAAEPRRVCLGAELWWYRFPPFIRHDRFLNTHLQVLLGFAFLLGGPDQIQRMLLLFEDQVGAACSGRRDQHELGYLLLA